MEIHVLGPFFERLKPSIPRGKGSKYDFPDLAKTLLPQRLGTEWLRVQVSFFYSLKDLWVKGTF